MVWPTLGSRTAKEQNRTDLHALVMGVVDFLTYLQDTCRMAAPINVSNFRYTQMRDDL